MLLADFTTNVQQTFSFSFYYAFNALCSFSSGAFERLVSLFLHQVSTRRLRHGRQELHMRFMSLGDCLCSFYYIVDETCLSRLSIGSCFGSNLDPSAMLVIKLRNLSTRKSNKLASLVFLISLRLVIRINCVSNALNIHPKSMLIQHGSATHSMWKASKSN